MSYGQDVSTFPDFDDTGRTISEKRAVAECLLRRYTTPNGWLDYDPSFGLDLRDLLNEDLDANDMRRIQVLAKLEALKDERIDDVEVTVSLESSVLKIRIVGTLADDAGGFEFVLAIDKVSASVLSGA